MATRRRTAQLVRHIFEVLSGESEALPTADVLSRLEETLPMTAEEKFPDDYHGLKPFEEAAQLGAIAAIKAGWLESTDSGWRVTPAGLDGFARHQDPEEFYLKAGARSIKGWVVSRAPSVYLWAARAKNQIEIERKMLARVGVANLLRAVLGLSAGWQGYLPIQKPCRYRVAGLAVHDYKELGAYFRSVGLQFINAGHTYYLPPEEARHSVFKDILEHYPDDAGLKIVKRPGGEHGPYLFGDVRQRKISALYNRLTYNRRHLLLVANLLFSEKINARIYDLIEMECGSLWSAYIVQHVIGRTPTFSECERGVERIRRLEEQGVFKITLADGYLDSDIACPECNGNALTDSAGNFYYIDFQSFLLIKYERYLNQALIEAARTEGAWETTEQSAPGDHATRSAGSGATAGSALKRLVNDRGGLALNQLLERNKLSLAGRLVLDFGSGSGWSIARYLGLGAGWCHGWQRPEASAKTERLLLALGCTRFSLSCRQAETDSNFENTMEQDIPHFLTRSMASCVVALSDGGPSGPVLKALAAIPWAFIIYESTATGSARLLNDFRKAFGDRISLRVIGEDYEHRDGTQRMIAIIGRRGTVQSASSEAPAYLGAGLKPDTALTASALNAKSAI